ncbi:MAG TPA: HEAT repeat domain-containing protein [Planctomycetota bacterium]|nr:HEAT repeat domain-containing protein [Planctomycetota bacterium]
MLARRGWFVHLAAVVLAGLIAGSAAAHGASYPPPHVPKDKAKPPGSGAAGAAAATGAPSGASRGAIGGATAASRLGRTPRAGVPAVTLGDDLPMVPDTWEQWWFDNQDRLLSLRERLDKRPHTLPAPGLADTLPTRRTTDAQVRDEILPVLYQLLKDEHETDVLDSALVALGRCAVVDAPDRAIDVIRPFLAHRDASVQTAAVLALGIQGAAQSVPLLGALMADDAAGRRAVADDAVSPLTRALAALALGLCNHPSAVPRLEALLDETTDSERDLKACLITALGLTANEASDEALVALRARLTDRKLDAVLKAYVPLSLSRLDGGSRPEVTPALVAAFDDRDTDDLVRTSCAIALGEVDSAGQGGVLDVLRAGTQAHNARTRHCSLIALAEIAARVTAPGDGPSAFHAAVAELLGRALDKPASGIDHPFAALAVGLYLRGAGGARHAWLGDRLLAQHAAQRDDSVRSAFAIALGLAGVHEAGPSMAEDAAGTGDTDRRGYAAIALGMLDDHSADASLLTACAAKDTPPALRVQFGLALALLGSTEAVPALTGLLDSAASQEAAVSAARTLGEIGDVAALPALLAVARNPDRQPLTRGMACVALGLLGERTPLPWNSRLRATHNGDARVAAIEFVLDIL